MSGVMSERIWFENMNGLEDYLKTVYSDDVLCRICVGIVVLLICICEWYWIIDMFEWLMILCSDIMSYGYG